MIASASTHTSEPSPFSRTSRTEASNEGHIKHQPQTSSVPVHGHESFPDYRTRSNPRAAGCMRTNERCLKFELHRHANNVLEFIGAEWRGTVRGEGKGPR